MRRDGEWTLLDGSEWFNVLMEKFSWLFGEKGLVLYKDFISARNPHKGTEGHVESNSYFKQAAPFVGAGVITGTGVGMTGLTTTIVAGEGTITSTGGPAFVASTLPDGIYCVGPIGWGLLAGAATFVVTFGGYGFYKWQSRKVPVTIRSNEEKVEEEEN